nr:4Fe-4S dicluster domain-containing protein [Clostridia bacterium]
CTFAPDTIPEPFEDKGCIHCGRCRRACPSHEECLSDLTQRKAEPSEETMSLMRRYNTAWGCDICQKVCPLNTAKKHTPIQFFKEKLYWNAADALAADDKDRAYYWRGRKVIERNIEIVNNTYKNQQNQQEERPVN